MNDNIKRIRYSVEQERIAFETLREVIELDISEYHLNCKIADIIMAFLSKVYEEYVSGEDWQHILTCLDEHVTYIHISDDVRYEIKEDTKNRLIIINIYDTKIKNVIYDFEKVHEENNQ